MSPIIVASAKPVEAIFHLVVIDNTRSPFLITEIKKIVDAKISSLDGINTTNFLVKDLVILI